MKGNFVFILGHSGAGKSTFLKLIQMEEKPTEGKIYINDQDLTTIKRRKVPYLRRQMGAVVPGFPPDPHHDGVRERGFCHARDQHQ